MKKLLMIALALGVVAAFAMPAVALRAPDNLTLEVPGQPSVAFDHAAHVAVAKSCKECHHMGVGNGSCSDCHGKFAKAPSLADAWTNCKTCHTTPAPAPVPVPEPVPEPASCSDYSDKTSCRADADCRWNWRKKICKDR